MAVRYTAYNSQRTGYFSLKILNVVSIYQCGQHVFFRGVADITNKFKWVEVDVVSVDVPEKNDFQKF